MPIRRLDVNEAIVWEIERAFLLLRQTIKVIPQDQRSRGANDGLVPARQVCHIMGFFLGYPAFGLPRSLARRIPAAKLPTKAEVLATLPKAYVLACDRARKMLDLAAAKRGPFHSPVTTVLYWLTHTLLHLGHLRAELKARGIKCKGSKLRMHLARSSGS